MDNSFSHKLTLPMYKPCNNPLPPGLPTHPPVKKTSAEIIKEARETIVKPTYPTDGVPILPDSSMRMIKPVNTQRPFTPKDSQRILFGRTNTKFGPGATARPPSSFSLRYLQYENNDPGKPSTPPERPSCGPGKEKRFLQKQASEIYQVPMQDVPIAKIKLPSIDACFKPFNKYTGIRSQNSLEKLPEEKESQEHVKVPMRKAYSSPAADCGTPGRYHQNGSLILEPRNLDNIFPNKQIIYDSDNLFGKHPLDFGGVVPRPSSITSILEQLSDSATLSCDDLIKHFILLYDSLASEGYVNSSKKMGSKLKLNILKCLYKYVECNNERVLLYIARIILAIKVTGSNLTGVCKLVFKIARDDKNDVLFSENNTLELFLESLGSASPIEDTEALIYGYGAIKFLTMNSKLLSVILNQGVLQLIVLHIKLINNTKIENLPAPEQISHVLFQITGALRNLANDENIYEDFIKSGAISELCQSVELFTTDVDVVSNISRIFSIISTDTQCCETIVGFENIFVVFVSLFEKYPGKPDMIVRLGYTLGNLVALFDYSRYKFYNARNSIQCLINVIEVYIEKPEGEDVIIKMIRIIANVSMNSDVGHELLTNHGTRLIDMLISLLAQKPITDSHELILSTLSTLNNLSYYFTTDNDKNAFFKKQQDLCEQLHQVTVSPNRECITEALRVLGNLTRAKISREFVIESHCLEKLITFLEVDDMDLLKTSVGVFINMMADDATRMIFKQEKGITKLIKLLTQYGETDWTLSALICQVIWNYCIDTTNIGFIIDKIDINQLLGLLVDYLDEERIFGITEENTADISDVLSSEDYILWEEFATVGTNLLEKIEHFMDSDSTIPPVAYSSRNSDDEDVYVPLEFKENA